VLASGLAIEWLGVKGAAMAIAVLTFALIAPLVPFMLRVSIESRGEDSGTRGGLLLDREV